MQVRHEEQQYLTIADLQNETKAPTKNDVVYVQPERRAYRWHEGDSTAQLLPYVIDQTSETANGRWIAEAISKVVEGDAPVTVTAIDNGNAFVGEGTATGVLLGRKNDILVTNADVLPENVFITFKEVTANDTVKLLVENQSGEDITTSFDIEFVVLEQ